MPQLTLAVECEVLNADSIGYDPKTKYLYIDNGGGDVHKTTPMLRWSTLPEEESGRHQD